MTKQQPWYRHPWPWLLMLGPFVVVVAGIATAYLAFKTDEGLVDDDYYKEGLAINQSIGRDYRAAELGMQAELKLDAERKMIRVSLQQIGSAALPNLLKLRLTHPTRAGQDQSLSLVAEGGSFYASNFLLPLAGRWHVVLEDSERQWRLADDWVVEHDLVLKPQAAFVKPADTPSTDSKAAPAQ